MLNDFSTAKNKLALYQDSASDSTYSTSRTCEADDTSYRQQYGRHGHRTVKVLEDTDPLVRIKFHSKELGKSLGQLKFGEQSFAVQLTLNEINNWIDPILHAELPYAPELSENWRGQFYELLENPKIRNVKSKKSSRMRKKTDKITEGVLGALRKNLLGKIYDKLRELLEQQQSGLTLINIINAVLLTNVPYPNAISPKLLVNAVNDAGYFDYIEDYKDLLDNKPDNSARDLPILPKSTGFKRQNYKKHSWSSRESEYASSQTKLDRLQTLTESSISIYSTTTPRINKNNLAATSSHETLLQMPAYDYDDAPKYQLPVYDNNTISCEDSEQVSASKYPFNSAQTNYTTYQGGQDGLAYRNTLPKAKPRAEVDLFCQSASQANGLYATIKRLPNISSAKYTDSDKYKPATVNLKPPPMSTFKSPANYE